MSVICESLSGFAWALALKNFFLGSLDVACIKIRVHQTCREWRLLEALLALTFSIPGALVDGLLTSLFVICS
jgi:hypothetical protein